MTSAQSAEKVDAGRKDIIGFGDIWAPVCIFMF